MSNNSKSLRITTDEGQQIGEDIVEYAGYMDTDVERLFQMNEDLKKMGSDGLPWVCFYLDHSIYILETVKRAARFMSRNMSPDQYKSIYEWGNDTFTPSGMQGLFMHFDLEIDLDTIKSCFRQLVKNNILQRSTDGLYSASAQTMRNNRFASKV